MSRAPQLRVVEEISSADGYRVQGVGGSFARELGLNRKSYALSLTELASRKQQRNVIAALAATVN